ALWDDGYRRRLAAVRILRTADAQDARPHSHSARPARRHHHSFGPAVGVPGQRRHLPGADAALVADDPPAEIRSAAAPTRPGDGGQHRLVGDDYRQPAE